LAPSIKSAILLSKAITPCSPELGVGSSLATHRHLQCLFDEAANIAPVEPKGGVAT
jgi:hypothetical protein